jgi:hypothetical protein
MMRPMHMAAAAVAMLLLAHTASARVQPTMFCWMPDAEFPVACEEEGEGDDDDAIRGSPR